MMVAMGWLLAFLVPSPTFCADVLSSARQVARFLAH